MIVDNLNAQIDEMKELHDLESKQKNSKRQAAIDQKYHELVEKIFDFFQTFAFVQQELDFTLPDMVKQQLNALLVQMKSVAESGPAEQKMVEESEKDFEIVQASVSEEWKAFYNSSAEEMLNTLTVLKNLDPVKINNCISEISAAGKWQTNCIVYAQFKKAMETAGSIIHGFSMSAEAKTFLTKMAQGKATLTDLNESVLEWIKEEKLENKISLSFQ